MSYCCEDHRVAHREKHNRDCNEIKMSFMEINREPPNRFPPDLAILVSRHNRTWAILTRCVLAKALLRIGTYEAVETAEGHFMEVLRLDRSDKMGIRNRVPALKLRLGRDQECYDFCKWWATVDWSNIGDLSQPYLDIQNADVFERPPEGLNRSRGGISHCVAITLLQIKLLVDVSSLQRSFEAGIKLPEEVFRRIRELVVRTSVVAENRDIMSAEGHEPLLKELEYQIRSLYTAVKILNRHFWPALLGPGEYLRTLPEDSSRAEAQLVFNHYYDAWEETVGALDVIRRLSEEDHWA